LFIFDSFASSFCLLKFQFPKSLISASPFEQLCVHFMTFPVHLAPIIPFAALSRMTSMRALWKLLITAQPTLIQHVSTLPLLHPPPPSPRRQPPRHHELTPPPEQHLSHSQLLALLLDHFPPLARQPFPSHQLFPPHPPHPCPSQRHHLKPLQYRLHRR
jgi:hypothetical protein